jgi:CubicO group peptidase (beta-lactamase class C family)
MRPNDADLQRAIDEMRQRHPAVGLAVAAVHDRDIVSTAASGLANIAGGIPVTGDTVFRIGSVTKVFTAIAVLQLAERGFLNLDMPANNYLLAYQLIPADDRWRPVSVRHLLTHTAGVPDVRRPADLLHADLTPSGGRPPLLSVPVGEPLPSLADYYGGGLRVVVEPGTAFAYSNHGYATLGQIVEDVGGMPLERYLRAHIFEPLGMADTDLVRSEHVSARLATGYAMRGASPRIVRDREWIGAGGGGIYSTPRDMARFATALLGDGANEHGAILEPATLATMYQPQYQPDSRLPGMGLGFFRHDVGGHRVVGHDGILPGFNSVLLLAPDDGVGLFAVTNGASGAFAWLPDELRRLVRELLGTMDDDMPGSAPHHPELWAGLCGRYGFPPRVADLRMWLMLGAGAEVFAGGGGLKVRLLLPIPVAYRGFPLVPADENDPDVYRLDLSQAGMAPVRVVFARDEDDQVSAVHTDLGGQPWSLVRLADAGAGRRLRTGMAAVAGMGLISAGWWWRRRRKGARG